jgi:hypothetical protein
MSRAMLKNVWSRMPAWGALMLGLGVLIAGNARADHPKPSELTPDLSGQSPSRSDEVALRLDGESIYLSQRGGAFEELRLGETREAAHLKKLLRDAGGEGQSVSVPIGSTIVAGGGGGASGWSSKSKEKPPPPTSEDRK